MRDPNRIEPILNDLMIIWKEHPELRLCQLLSNIAFAGGWKNNDLFYIEDDKIAEQLKKELGNQTRWKVTSMGKE